ncbi:MAG TPA: hypothetical protein VHN79_07260 [Lacunisphaera sp.]|nr:hypothetical protein [Lacunisphaera sp.]
MTSEEIDRQLALVTELEFRVARRADELARVGFCVTSLKLGCWLQAEQEIFREFAFESTARPPPGA